MINLFKMIFAVSMVSVSKSFIVGSWQLAKASVNSNR